jgi:hypothetical protein
VRERIDVIERREIKLERGGAIDTAAAAVAHRGALDRALLISGGEASSAPNGAGNAREGYTVKMPTS